MRQPRAATLGRKSLLARGKNNLMLLDIEKGGGLAPKILVADLDQRDQLVER